MIELFGGRLEIELTRPVLIGVMIDRADDRRWRWEITVLLICVGASLYLGKRVAR